MIGRVARLVVEYPLLTILAVVGLIVAGVRSYQTLPIDAVPDLTNVQVQVLTSAPAWARRKTAREHCRAAGRSTSPPTPAIRPGLRAVEGGASPPRSRDESKTSPTRFSRSCSGTAS